MFGPPHQLTIVSLADLIGQIDGSDWLNQWRLLNLVQVIEGDCTGGCIKLTEVHNSIVFQTTDSSINSVIGTIPCRQSMCSVVKKKKGAYSGLTP